MRTINPCTYFLHMLLVLIMLPSCGKHETELKERIDAVSQLSELGTVEYTFSKLYAADGTSWYKYGTRKALFKAEAHVKAGIRMDGFDRSRVRIDSSSGTVKVILPPAEILSFNMPPEEIDTAYVHVSGLRSSFSAAEQVEFARKAEQSMRAFVDSSDILRDAERNAEMYFKAMLSHLGYGPASVEVIFEPYEKSE